jgi:hypothetical protein
MSWRSAVEAHDLDQLAEALAPEAKLRSPITTRIPFEGRERVAELMAEIFELIESVRVVRDIRDGTVQMLEIETRLAGEDIHMVQLLEHDDQARVRQITLFMRPMPAVANLAAHLGPRLVRRRRGRVVAALTAPALWLVALVARVNDRLSPYFA